MKKTTKNSKKTAANTQNEAPAKAKAPAKFLIVNKVSQRFSKEEQQAKFWQEQGGYAAYDAEYNKLSLFISTIGSPIQDKNGIMSWRFSMSFNPAEITIPGFVKVNSLRKYCGKDGQFGYYRDNAGYATVANGDKCDFLNIHVDSLPAMVTDKNGLLSHRFDIRLNEEQKQLPAAEKTTTNETKPHEFADDEDVPF